MQGHSVYNIKSIKIPENAISKSKLQLEFIYNTYFDPLYTFEVFKINKQTKDLVEVDHKYIVSGNFIWVVLNMDKSTEYIINFSSGVYENISFCTEAYVSYSIVNQLVMDKMITKANCEVNAKLPKFFFDNSKGTLTAYGNGQDRSNGEMYFYGTFLLPKRGNSIRSEFIIKEDSLAFIQIVPKYKSNVNDIVVELFHGRNKISSIMHSVYNGLVQCLSLSVIAYSTFQINV